MARTIVVQDLVTDALELSGKAGSVVPARAQRAVQRAVIWCWRELAAGFEGFAERQTEILSPTTGDFISILAGEGGAAGSDPIVRGVFKVRGLYRPIDGNQADNRYPVRHVPRTTYFDKVAPLIDRPVVVRPGFYWYELHEDGAVDKLIFRPGFEDLSPMAPEQIRLVYTPVAPSITSLADPLEMLNNAEDAISHRAGYYLLSAQNRQLALQLMAQGDVLVQSAILSYKGERDQNGPDDAAKYRRRNSRWPWSGGLNSG